MQISNALLAARAIEDSHFQSWLKNNFIDSFDLDVSEYAYLYSTWLQASHSSLPNNDSLLLLHSLITHFNQKYSISQEDVYMPF